MLTHVAVISGVHCAATPTATAMTYSHGISGAVGAVFVITTAPVGPDAVYTDTVPVIVGQGLGGGNSASRLIRYAQPVAPGPLTENANVGADRPGVTITVDVAVISGVHGVGTPTPIVNANTHSPFGPVVGAALKNPVGVAAW